jgi:hypothetical protein
LTPFAAAALSINLGFSSQNETGLSQTISSGLTKSKNE